MHSTCKCDCSQGAAGAGCCTRGAYLGVVEDLVQFVCSTLHSLNPAPVPHGSWYGSQQVIAEQLDAVQDHGVQLGGGRGLCACTALHTCCWG